MTPLARNYQKACNDYVQAFCQKHDFELPEVWERWVADEVGEIAVIGDFFISMRDIITDIEEDVPEEKFLEYYDWCLEDGHNWNYKTWLKGGPTPLENYAMNLKEVKRCLQESIEKDTCPF